MDNLKQWVGWFRSVSPYINAQRGQTLVLALSGEAAQHSNFENIIHDIALLDSLGIKIAIVFGARPQIEAALKQQNVSSIFHKGLRVTCSDSLPHVLEAYGRLRSEIEARLSMGVVNSPMQGSKIKLVSGNYVTAKPKGILDGVDMQHTGTVRKVQSETVQQYLDMGALVLIPSIGYSISGDIFNLSYEELAAEVAVSLGADKLVYLGDETGQVNIGSSFIGQLTAEEVLSLNDAEFSQEPSKTQLRLLTSAADACQKGVGRSHLLGYACDGALLEELFTRDGQGTMVSIDDYDQIRPARLEDLNGILKLIRPLEEQGYLVRRSRERLETELDYFLVEVRDNAIIACVGLYPFPEDQSAELSCFAVDSLYRNKGRGDRLLEAVTKRAMQQNLSRLFVLTTKTEHWFKERGFTVVSPTELPGLKNYNSDRNAKVLVKHIC